MYLYTSKISGLLISLIMWCHKNLEKLFLQVTAWWGRFEGLIVTATLLHRHTTFYHLIDTHTHTHTKQHRLTWPVSEWKIVERPVRWRLTVKCCLRLSWIIQITCYSHTNYKLLWRWTWLTFALGLVFGNILDIFHNYTMLSAEATSTCQELLQNRSSFCALLYQTDTGIMHSLS